MDPVIKIKKLNFTYNKGNDNEFRALTNIDLEVFPEEFVIIFGPSGCGKSTLLHLIAGLESPESGEINVFGKDLTKMSKKALSNYHKRDVGIVYQSYNLISSLSVLDNVSLPQIFININRFIHQKSFFDRKISGQGCSVRRQKPMMSFIKSELIVLKGENADRDDNKNTDRCVFIVKPG